MKCGNIVIVNFIEQGRTFGLTERAGANFCAVLFTRGKVAKKVFHCRRRDAKRARAVSPTYRTRGSRAPLPAQRFPVPPSSRY